MGASDGFRIHGAIDQFDEMSSEEQIDFPYAGLLSQTAATSNAVPACSCSYEPESADRSDSRQGCAVLRVSARHSNDAVESVTGKFGSPC